jgi:small subunit ribosomal protein S8
MSMTDPIADMLTRIRNACGAKHRRVDMPGSKMKVEIARILKDNNFIQDFRTLEEENGLRKYVGVSEIPRVRNGLGMAILSTSQGLMSDRQARQARTGGEILALIW